MTDKPKLSPGAAWAWVGIALSVSLNVLAAWIIVQVVNRPEAPLPPPPAQERAK